MQIAADPGDEVIYAWRSFEAYPIVTAISSAQSVQVQLTPQARHDVQAMVETVGDRTRVMFLCTPNNPTGPALTHDEVQWVLDNVPEHLLVVVDEAYHEYVQDPAAVRALEITQRHANVLVLRTFSKAFGLAGLRVGYGVGAPEVISAMRKVATRSGCRAWRRPRGQCPTAGGPCAHAKCRDRNRRRARPDARRSAGQDGRCLTARRTSCGCPQPTRSMSPGAWRNTA